MIDPKPNLSRAAIEANIEYYKSRCDKYRQGYKEAKQDLKKWEQRLNEISLNADQH
jgi:prefoldin subunit 5